jgi:protein-tyrosine-phosphatase
MSTRAEAEGVLFLCVANSARSQMAEALARHLAPNGTEVFSAGSVPSRVHPFAVRVLEEIGIDCSRLYSKPLTQVPRDRVGTVVTLCEEELCPVFPAPVARLHWPLGDPAACGGSDLDVLAAFRRTRDDLRSRLGELFPPA